MWTVSCGLLGVQLPPGPSHLVALALAGDRGWRYVDRTTFDFYRSHHPASCELMKDGRENQLCKTFGFEQDRGQIRVNEGLACTVPHSVVLKLLGAARPQVGPKSSRHLGAVSTWG